MGRTRRREAQEIALSDDIQSPTVYLCPNNALRPVGAHSLRSGFLTEAAKAGASLPKMQEVSRQKKVEVLLGYVRDAALFENHAGESFL
jgi:hypothetical protein